jgi:hypothetical protein
MLEVQRNWSPLRHPIQFLKEEWQAPRTRASLFQYIEGPAEPFEWRTFLRDLVLGSRPPSFIPTLLTNPLAVAVAPWDYRKSAAFPVVDHGRASAACRHCDLFRLLQIANLGSKGTEGRVATGTPGATAVAGGGPTELGFTALEWKRIAAVVLSAVDGGRQVEVCGAQCSLFRSTALGTTTTLRAWPF